MYKQQSGIAAFHISLNIIAIAMFVYSYIVWKPVQPYHSSRKVLKMKNLSGIMHIQHIYHIKFYYSALENRIWMSENELLYISIKW